jgi:dihydrofolate reductase
MRKIVGTVFVSLDGVMQAPGGVKEDITGGFAHGGWQFKFPDPAADATLGATFDGYDLLLGRRTYEGFAEAWPSRTDESGFADKMNSMPKYVVSATMDDAEWTNSTVVPDVSEIPDLKQRHDGDLLVYGSATLLAALVEQNLVDELRLMIFPVVLGAGKRLFPDGLARRPFALAETTQAGETAIVTLRRVGA